MGSSCNCHKTFNPQLPKLLQINTESNDDIIITNINSNSDTNNNLGADENLTRSQCSQNNRPLFLSILDINNEKCYSSNINLRILSSLKGLSQLNVNNSLFLCGTSDITSTTGSYLLKLELQKKKAEPLIKFLISSHFVHMYPSLYFSQSIKSLFVVGGKGQIKCEIFDTELSQWNCLPDLPEERYFCTLMLNARRSWKRSSRFRDCPKKSKACRMA